MRNIVQDLYANVVFVSEPQGIMFVIQTYALKIFHCPVRIGVGCVGIKQILVSYS